MRLLLDTHVFLWVIAGDQRLPANMRDSIRDLDNEVYLSVVSLWEATVKYQLGRLPLPGPPDTFLPDQRRRHEIASLPLDEASVSKRTSTEPLPPNTRYTVTVNPKGSKKLFVDLFGNAAPTYQFSFTTGE